MEEVKSLIQSRTFWAASLGLAAGLGGIFHYTISPADQAHAVDAILSVVGAVGSIGAIVGRVYASKKIGSMK